MSQNRSHAVMSQRAEPHDSLDFFPTPPWATRALCEHVLARMERPDELADLSVWEPACGDGAMARPLGESFGTVYASDVYPYGFGETKDFLFPATSGRVDWIITNPPFRMGEQFARHALSIAERGVALLVRTAFLESQDRFKLYSEHPPTVVAQFVERVPMVKGRLQRDASTATAYCWIVWKHGETDTRFKWIPPCKKQLDRDGDWPATPPAPPAPPVQPQENTRSTL